MLIRWKKLGWQNYQVQTLQYLFSYFKSSIIIISLLSSHVVKELFSYAITPLNWYKFLNIKSSNVISSTINNMLDVCIKNNIKWSTQTIFGFYTFFKNRVQTFPVLELCKLHTAWRTSATNEYDDFIYGIMLCSRFTTALKKFKIGLVMVMRDRMMKEDSLFTFTIATRMRKRAIFFQALWENLRLLKYISRKCGSNK